MVKKQPSLKTVFIVDLKKDKTRQEKQKNRAGVHQSDLTITMS
ncbi:hypothetical protein SMU66_06274 [Streptococcus mutans N34]|nr:hypothetical protein SMU66_06274 [Streptococcus mutans N34]EMC16188.1 hypothetical protein SMU77_08211 [Streptococcus mutans NV1996]EMC54353.1 hypothetical protein SMU105_02462 [Streptococcus mutans SF12]